MVSEQSHRSAPTSTIVVEEPYKIEGAKLLDTLIEFLRRFVRVTDPQASILSVWVAHTHAVSAARETPYVAIFSAEKQSGKTRLLEVLELLVNTPWLTGRVTAACLVRKIDQVRPTLLLDESDAAFHGEKEYSEALRGILNTGHREDGKASLCVGQGANLAVKDFRTFCPKAIAGIGRNLPDTVADRSIPIHLKRQAPGERVERFRRRDLKPQADELRRRLSDWLSGIALELRDARPALPEQLTDRQQDGLEPLCAIADAAGGAWPERIRRAALEIYKSVAAEDQSVGVQLLNDIRDLFIDVGGDKISSEDLIVKLREIESSPWTDWDHGKGLSKGKLARLLKKYDISSRKIRISDRSLWGYLRESFQDAWTRYLPPETTAYTTTQSGTTEQPASLLTQDHLYETEQKSFVPDSKSASELRKDSVVPHVPFSNRDYAFASEDPAHDWTRLVGKNGCDVMTPRGVALLLEAVGPNCIRVALPPDFATVHDFSAVDIELLSCGRAK